MRILYVCNEYPPERGGGIGVFVRLLAVALVKAGHSISVIGYSSNLSEDTQDMDEGVAIVRLADLLREKKILRFGKYHFSLKPFILRRNLSRRIELVIKEFRPDFVESYDWSGPLWSKPSVPLIVRLHGANAAHNYMEGKRSSRLIRFFEKRNLKMATSLCAVSQHIGDITCAAFELKRNYSVIYNFTDTDYFKEAADEYRDFNKILYVGRIDKRKGLIELFKAMNLLFKLNSKVYLELVGNVSNEFEIELLSLTDLSYRDRIKFAGFIDHNELPNMYSQAALFVMPSRAEAFGITAIEAMSCCTAVAITAKASGPEIVSHDRDGYLLDFSDAEATANQLYKYLKDTKRLEAVGRVGRDKVLNNFSAAKIIPLNIDFYQKVLRNEI